MKHLCLHSKNMAGDFRTPVRREARLISQLGVLKSPLL